MWMHDNAGGMVAALYGPSTGQMNFDNGKTQLSITETTNYPFSDHIRFNFDITTPRVVPFSFRIPAWCTSPVVTINGKKYTGSLTPGSFVTITRQVHKKDVIMLQLPMPARLVQYDTFGVTVERGPLLFAYPIPEKVTIDTATYANLGGKRSPDPAFPALDIRPAGPWNYGLAVTEKNFLQKVQVRQQPNSGYPFDPSALAVVIRVPARKLKGWTLKENRYTPALPAAGTFKTEDKEEMITLVPYGSTRLRMSVFPAAIPAAGSGVRSFE
jgi:hypothetical protein